VAAFGLSPEALALLPESRRTLRLDAVRPVQEAVLVGRQHQRLMFEGLLANQQDLLSFVSRSHLQVDAAGDRSLCVTNLSQNAVLVNMAIILQRGKSARLASGDSFSFAAHVELLRDQGAGGAMNTAPPTSGTDSVAESVSIAPFLTFRILDATHDAAASAQPGF